MFQQEFFAYILDTQKSHQSENLSEHTNSVGIWYHQNEFT